MNINGQGHSLTSVQGHSDSTFSNFFSLQTAGLVGTKFHMEPPWDRGIKDSSNGSGHMTNVGAVPIFSKNLLLWNQKVDYLESWYAALGTQVLPSLFK